MPYRLLVTGIPIQTGEEEFYDYVRAHAGGDAVINALLIMRPENAHSVQKHGSSSADRALAVQDSLISSGAALVDYATKGAADTAMQVNFYIDGSLVMLKAVGCVATVRQHDEAVEAEGREAYRKLRCGLGFPRETTADVAGRPKRPRDSSNVDAHEMDLRLVGIPSEVYGRFLLDTVAHDNDVTGAPAATATRRSAVQLFMDVALSIRRATLGELLSMRRISDDEAVIRVSTDTGSALLDRGVKGLDLLMTAANNDTSKLFDGHSARRSLSVRHPRPSVQVSGNNFTLAKKQEVLQAMARLMEFTNAKVAGFIDPFGNLLLPSC